MFGLVNAAGSRDSAVARFGVPIGAVLCAFGAQLALAPVLGDSASFLLYAFAVMVAVRYGGMYAGFAATIVSASLAWIAVALRRDAAASSVWAATVLFGGLGVGISLLGRQLKDASRTAILAELARTVDVAPFIVRRLDGHITYWSNGAAILYGWSSAEAVGRVSHDLLRTEFPRDMKSIEAELYARGRWEGELCHHRRDGVAVEVASYWALHRDKSGTPRSVIEINNDISAQKRIERELRASEERLELAQASAGIATWDWNIEEGWTVCSEGYRELYGIPSGRCAPTPAQWLQLIHPADRADVQRVLARALVQNTSYEAEFRILRPDGKVRWLLSKGRARRDASGKAVRMIGANLDITQRKLASEQLRALSASLISAQEEERRRISRELHDDLVQRLGLMAIDLGKVISRFGKQGGELAAELRAIQQRTAEAAELTRHIAHELHPWILDDLGIAAALGSLCAEVGRREGFDVEFSSGDLPAGIPREIAACLYAVAQETLQNVSKHARAARVEVRLSSEDGMIRLEISDNGIGCRVEAAAAGVGLGIDNMRERVRWANGVFRLESEPGRGARVTVVLPKGAE
jgi:two-component system sensor histidine kinase UhpB